MIHGDKGSIFDLIMMDGALERINVRTRKGFEALSDKEKRVAEAFINKYHRNIIEKMGKVLCVEASCEMYKH